MIEHLEGSAVILIRDRLECVPEGLELIWGEILLCHLQHQYTGIFVRVRILDILHAKQQHNISQHASTNDIVEPSRT